jgi:glycosyltransferase involved in cell wall biosynthesis
VTEANARDHSLELDGFRALHHAGGASAPRHAASGRIAILLCTYNGARFLPTQLQSLAEQSWTGWRLIWRDDGSTDETPDILRRFAADRPAGQVVEHASSGRHLGVFDGFMTLLDGVEPDEMAAFCDQDDRWLSGKLARAATLLARVPDDRPGLYCSRQTLTDGTLTPTGVSASLSRPVEFPACLVENVVTGCTALLNSNAVAALRAAARPRKSLHDWWAFILVLALGGDVIFDEMPSILYRQHGGNSVGAAPSMAERLRRALRCGPKTLGGQLFDHLDALLANQHRIGAQRTRIVRRIRAAYAGNLLQRLGLLAIPGLRRQQRLASIVNDAFLIFGPRGEK